MEKENQIKKWISTWKKAGDSLNDIRINELRDKNYYIKNRDILNSMLQYAYDNRTVKLESGLFIQQNIFKKIYYKSISQTNG